MVNYSYANKSKDGTLLDPTAYLPSDPKNDIEEIRNGTIRKLVFVSEHIVSTMLGRAGAFKGRDFMDSYLYFYNESLGASESNTRGESNPEFLCTFIPSFLEKEGASQQPNPENKSTYESSPNLYIPQGTYMAFHHMNFGIFYGWPLETQ